MVNQDVLLYFINRIFSLGNDRVKIERTSINEVIVTNLVYPDKIELKFNRVKKSLDITEWLNNHTKTISIPASSVNRVQINVVSFAIENLIFSSIDINEVIAAIMASNISKADLHTLGTDELFKSYLKVQKEIYNNNCNELFKNDLPAAI